MSNNKSHRKYIKEKTNEIVNLYPNTSKSELKLKKSSLNAPKTNEKLNDNSIALNSQRDTSFSKGLKLRDSTYQSKEGNIKKGSKYYLKMIKCISSEPISKIKSQEIISVKKHCSSSVRKSFSVKKHLNILNNAQRNSVESIESKKIQRIDIKQVWKQPRNQNYLKHTQPLKKTSGKLKLKVKDPFQKKMKLDNQFQDQSVIRRNQQSFISTINQDQFRQILNKIA